MSGQVNVGSIEDVAVFESKCLDYQYGLEQVRNGLQQSLAAVGETWRDGDYVAMENIVIEIGDLLNRGLQVVSEDLLPFVQRKRQVIEEK